MVVKAKFFKIFTALLCVVAIVFTATIIFLGDKNYIKNNLDIVKDNGAIVMATGNFDYNIISDKHLYKFIETNAKELGIKDVKKELTLNNCYESAVGKVYRMQQRYGETKVYGREMIISTDKNNKPLYISGNYLPNTKPNNKIVLEKADIIKKLSKYTVYSCELVVYTLGNSPHAYAYAAESGINGNTLSFYDAEDGSLLEQISNDSSVMVQQTNALGQKVEIDVYQQDGVNYLVDDLRNITVYDYSKKSYDGSPVVSWSQDTYLSDKIAVSVYDNIAKTYDFYADANNIGVSRKGIDGSHDNIANNADEKKEYELEVFIHFYPSGESKDYENAYFSQTSKSKVGQICVGDGKIGGLYQLGKAFDVIAHEYQHGITTKTANLIYLNQSGAINESLSDIFAALIGDESLDNENAWLIGESIVDNGNIALRNMMNPELLRDPSKYNGTYYARECYFAHDHEEAGCDRGGVHTNSSVINNIAYKIYKSDAQFYTKQRMATLWYNTLLSLPSDCSFNGLKINLLNVAKALGYSQQKLDTINDIFSQANITGISTISFVNDAYDIVGTLPDSIDTTTAQKFVLPNSNLAKPGYTLIGWGIRNQSISFDKIYYLNKEYDAPKESLTLYPVMAISAMNNSLLTDIKGEGTLQEPYLISTPQELMSLAYYINNFKILEYIPLNNFRSTHSSWGNFKLADNIDMSSIGGNFIPININDDKISIHLDGDGYTISGVNITASYQHKSAIKSQVGLFANLYGSVSQLGVDVTITTDDYYEREIGGLAGYNQADVSVVKANVNINVKAEMGEIVVVGGIAGFSSQTITDCMVSGDINSEGLSSIAGGIVGSNLNNKINSRYLSDINLTISGRSVSTIVANSVSQANVKGAYVGGIVGETSNAKIVNVVSFGYVNAIYYAGGIVGLVNDWWKEDGSSSINTALDIVNADISIVGAHARSSLAGSTCGKLIGKYEKQGYSVVLDKVYSVESGYNLIGKGMPAAIKGQVDNFDNIDLAQDSLYSETNCFGVVGQGNAFAMGSIWKMKDGQLSLNIGVEDWTDYATDGFAGGSGQESDPYLISDVGALATIAKKVNNGEFSQSISKQIFFKQTTDIDLFGKIWHSIGGVFDLSGKSRSAAIVYDGNGFTISNMVAREKSFTVYTLGVASDFTTYATLIEGKDSTIKNLKSVNFNNVGKNAAGIAVNINKILYCSAQGNIAAELSSGGLAVSAKEITGSTFVGEISGSLVGGLACSVEKLAEGNYVEANLTVADGEEFTQNSVGGLVAKTFKGNKADDSLTISNNAADVILTTLTQFCNMGGAIGTLVDYNYANAKLLNNFIKVKLSDISYSENGKYVSYGSLIGGGEMFSNSNLNTLSINVYENTVAAEAQLIGSRASKDFSKEISLSDIKTINYDTADVKQHLDEVIKNEDYRALVGARINGNKVAFVMGNNEVIDILEMVEGKFVIDYQAEMPEGYIFKYWRLIGENSNIDGKVFDDDIYVIPELESLTNGSIDNEDGLNGNNITSHTNVIYTIVGILVVSVIIGAIVVGVFILAKKRNR